MKYRYFLVFLLFCSCATPQVMVLNSPYRPKSTNSHIDVYKSTIPEHKYIEIAEITYNKNDIDPVLQKARSLGADGIIITGSAGVYATANWSLSGGVIQKDFGLKAVAIKYVESKN